MPDGRFTINYDEDLDEACWMLIDRQCIGQPRYNGAVIAYCDTEQDAGFVRDALNSYATPRPAEVTS